MKCKNNKCIFEQVSLIVGAIIGSGFASGKEVVTFFAEYGFLSLLFLPILFVILYYFLRLLLTAGNTKIILDKKNNNIYQILLALTYIICSSSMISSSNNLLNKVVCDFSFPMWGIVVSFFCYLCVKKGLTKISKINKLFTSSILLIILICCCFSFKKSAFSPFFLEFDAKNIIFLLISVFLYAGINLVLCMEIVKDLGEKMQKKDINKVAFISSFIVCCLLAIIILTLLICDSAKLFVPMPLVLLSYDINYLFGIVFSVIILMSIFSTFLASIYALNKVFLDSKILHKNSLFYSLIFSFLFSLFGFENIVNYLYPIIGGIGVFFLFLEKFNYESFSSSQIPIFNCCNNKIHSTCKNTKKDSARHNKV